MGTALPREGLNPAGVTPIDSTFGLDYNGALN